MAPVPETQRQTRFQAIQELLQRACQAHGWAAAAVVSEEGLPLAAMAGTYHAEKLAAAIAQLRRTAGQAQKQLGWSAVDEWSIAMSGGAWLVARSFSVQGQTLILAVISSGRMVYRRACAQIIRAIRQAWESR